MTRRNDFEDAMGVRYKEAMTVICPHEQVGYDLIKSRIDDLNLGVNENVLDLGCGSGEFLYFLGDFPKGGPWTCEDVIDPFLTGVDISDVMIRKALKLFKIPIKEGRARIVNADLTKYLESMNLVGQTSDVITSNFVLHNLTQEERAMALPLIYGALLEYGTFLTLDKIAVTDPAEHEAMYNSQLRTIRKLAEHGMPELVQPWLDHYAADNAPERRMIEGGLIEQLRQVGFREVRALYRGRMEAVVEAKK